MCELYDNLRDFSQFTINYMVWCLVLLNYIRCDAKFFLVDVIVLNTLKKCFLWIHQAKYPFTIIKTARTLYVRLPSGRYWLKCCSNDSGTNPRQAEDS